MKIPKQNKIKFINVFVIVVLSILIMTIVFLPKLRSNNLCNKEIADIKKVLAKLSQMENNSSEYNNKKNKITEGLNLISEKITRHPMIPQIIEQITKPIRELGISLISIKPLEAVKRGESQEEILKEGTGAEAYLETPIELVLRADYKQLGAYLDRLRHLPRLIIIDEFNIKGDKNISPKLAIRLKLSVFHYEKD